MTRLRQLRGLPAEDRRRPAVAGRHGGATRRSRTRRTSRSPTAPAASDRQRSFDAIEAVRSASTAPIAGHLTCVGQSRADVDDVIDRYLALGVDHIVALRGDPPGGVDAPYTPHPDGFTSTADLVAAVKRRADFDVSVSAYPERHPQSPTDDHDLDVLAAKVAAGADQAMTQMFFDNESVPRATCDRVRARGIDVPIVPGIFPIHSFPAVERFAARCGAIDPDVGRVDRFDGLDDDPIATREVAADSPPSRSSNSRHTASTTSTSTRSTEPTSRWPSAAGVRSPRPGAGMSSPSMTSAGQPRDRILVLDGASGTEIQSLGITEDDLRGERFDDHARSLAGNHDLLILSRPTRSASSTAAISPPAPTSSPPTRSRPRPSPSASTASTTRR